MVKMSKLTLLLLLFFFGLSKALFANVTVVALIDKAEIDQPIVGTVTIYQDGRGKIDPNSFKLNNQSLKVKFLSEKHEGNFSISTYSFQIPDQPKGLQLLPAVEVKVNGVSYYSKPSSYQVEDVSLSQGTGPWLKLTTVVDPSISLYPGQKFKVSYTIYYRGSIDLTVEQLPLLEPEGFQKVGGKDIKDSTEGDVSIQQIVQEFEAISPGKFSFPPSIIEGKAYTEDASGQPVYLDTKLNSQTQSVTIEVLTFPEKGKPPSFEGAIGNFTTKATLLTPKEISVGDEIQIGLEITGNGEKDTVKPPDLSCQPGFSGFFQMSSLPPQEKVTDTSKTFTYSMRSRSNLIKAIPSIEFSSFDPKTKNYVISRTEPIPIVIKQMTEEVDLKPMHRDTSLVATKAEIGNTWRNEWESLPEIPKDDHITLSLSDLKQSLPSKWKFLYVIPFLLIFLAMQYFLRETIFKPEPEIVTSRQLFQKAEQAIFPSPEFFSGIRKTLMLKLFESNVIDSMNEPIEQLPLEGAAGEVRQFLMDLEKKRYAGKESELQRDQILKSTQQFL